MTPNKIFVNPSIGIPLSEKHLTLDGNQQRTTARQYDENEP